MSEEFVEPKTFEEAVERKTQTSRDLMALETELARIVAEKIRRGRMPTDDFKELQRQKIILVNKKALILTELASLKEWLRKAAKNADRQVACDFDEFRKDLASVKEFLRKLTWNSFAMRDRIKELVAENNALHARLQVYELEQLNQSPGEGREAWRDDNFQQEGKVHA